MVMNFIFVFTSVFGIIEQLIIYINKWSKELNISSLPHFIYIYYEVIGLYIFITRKLENSDGIFHRHIEKTLSIKLIAPKYYYKKITYWVFYSVNYSAAIHFLSFTKNFKMDTNIQLEIFMKLPMEYWFC
jgi:hypothetical protein